MGILKEIFSKPIYGPNGALGDVAIQRLAQYRDDGLLHGSHEVEQEYPEQQQYRRTTDGIPYHWIQAPPGGALLNGKQYRSGQFVPGTTLFRHTAKKRQEADKPTAPVMYDPIPYAPPQTQQDDTHALPMPSNPGAPVEGAPVEGAPQTVGGEPLAMPGQGYPQGPNDLPPQPSAGQQAPGIPAPVPRGPQPHMTPGLSSEEALIEAQSQMFAWANYEALRDAYFGANAVINPVSGDVRSLMLDAEQWYPLIPGFTGSNQAVLKNAVMWLNNQLFIESLQNQNAKGNNTMLVVSGSGMGPATEEYRKAVEYPLLVEPPLEYERLAEQFERAKAAGMVPSYHYTDRPAIEGIQDGISKALEDRLSGRPVVLKSLESLASSNVAARRIALEVLFRNPEVDVVIIDHHNGQKFQRRMLTNRGEAAMYLSHRLAEDSSNMPQALDQLRQEIVARQKAGEIPADLVTGWLGAGWNVRPPLPVYPNRWGY